MDNKFPETPPQARPTIITVFGILTFIGSGLGLLGGLVSFANPTVAVSPILGILIVLACAGKIYGVMRMFKMEKIGFFIYTGCELVHVAANIISSRSTYDQMAWQMDLPMDIDTLILMGAVITLVFSLIWVGAYASQLSQME